MVAVMGWIIENTVVTVCDTCFNVKKNSAYATEFMCFICF